MKKYFEIVLVVPVGPNTNPAFLADTIDSFIHYTVASYKIIIIDDSGQGLGKQVQADNPAVDVLYNKKSLGSMAGLYISLSNAYAYAIRHYDFLALLKLDTDALIIGPHPEKEAMETFSANSKMGIAGQYPLDYSGKPWDVGWPRARIVNGTMTWKFIKRPIANMVLRKYYIRALTNGYKTGESVFGGAYFISKALLDVLDEHKLLPNYTLGRLNMGEDHLFGLLAKAVGFELGDLSSRNLPFGMAWKGLPTSPEQLFSQGKKVIHSTRNWKEMDEKQIREFFRKKREETESVSRRTTLIS